MQLERVPGIRQAPVRAARPRRDAVVFSSWRGAYNDNPRAIAEALHISHPDLEQVWVAHDGVVAQLPPWATPVLPGSRRYLSALGRASHLVSNVEMPGYYRKRGHTHYLQTWHGTPLKRIAFDIPGGDFPEHRRYLDRLRRDVAQWDAMLSPNPFSSAVLRDAFRYEGDVLETGYPRNDILRAPEAEALRSRVRAGLGLGPDARALLYAPTWRDTRGVELQLDVGALRHRLGDEHVLLLRAHPLAPIAVPSEHRPWVVDVSRHPDIRELYLAADVLLTDYSSSMFDFAVTGKPILFFAYDLAVYRDQLRGFYFDFESDAPGPFLENAGAICEALENLSAVTSAHARAYARFAERFCPWDDGAAGQRVVRAVFNR